MSDSNVEEELNNNSENVEENEEANHEENNDKDEIIKQIELKPGKTQRSDKTKFERAKDSKQRAIDNFKRGVPDPEYRVVKMTNGKFRCYPRKEPLPPDPIKLNQVPENKRSSDIVDNVVDNIDSAVKVKQSAKQHDPFSDIVYYNMSNQISEQLNKRLDAVNVELERLRNKNSKLKSKYKQLKQAIYITEEEERDEPQHEHEQHEQMIQHEEVQQPRQVNVESPVLRPTRRTTAINFNRFFN